MDSETLSCGRAQDPVIYDINEHERRHRRCRSAVWSLQVMSRCSLERRRQSVQLSLQSAVNAGNAVPNLLHYRLQDEQIRPD